MPTLILWGESDSVTPLPQGQQLAKLLPDATLVTLPGIGHIPQLEDAATFNPLLVEQLGRRLAPKP